VKDFARAVHDSAPASTSTAGSPPKNAKNMAGKVIFVNKTTPGSEWDGIIDYHVVGETDRWVERVVEEWKKMRPADWEVQKKLVLTGEGQSTGTFTVGKEITNTVGATKAKGGKRKGAVNRENAPSIDDLSTLPPLPPSPSSPGKRRQSDSHYDVESSPSKKRDAGERQEPTVFEERGLLFGDMTNTVGDVDTAAFDLGELGMVKTKASKKTSTKSKGQVEVVVDVPWKTKRDAQVKRVRT